MKTPYYDASRIIFAEIIDRPTFSGEPVASFVDARNQSKRVNYNGAALDGTIENEERNAELYPNGNARATLRHLYAARTALQAHNKG